jgi:glycosyltransferase involved in cell wall biosynthesis
MQPTPRTQHSTIALSSATSRFAYSAVIATLDRPALLSAALDSLIQQTRPPSRIIVVDASGKDETEAVVDRLRDRAPILYLRSPTQSAAQQRNLGAASVSTPFIAFIDDDVVLPAGTFSRLVAPFEGENGEDIGGVAGRIQDLGHSKPRGLLWWYYRLQAGYPHPNFGARLMGAAVNTLPCYEEQSGLIPSDWLNTTCVLYRTDLFLRERFPDFKGYSFMEDVHLSARIAKTHRLYFDGEAIYEHHSAPTAFKRNQAAHAAAAIQNRRIVARDVLSVGGFELELKMLLHRLFCTVAFARSRKEGWLSAVRGTWS